MDDFDSRAERNYCSRIGLTVVAAMACALVWSMVVTVADRLSGGMPQSLYYVLALSGHYVLTLPLALCLTRCVPRTKIPQQQEQAGQMGVWFLMGAAILWLGAVVGMAVNDFAYRLLGREPMDAFGETFELLPPVAALIGACILAPILEEVLFRGILADRLARYGQGRAALVSALLFGLFHGNFMQFFYAFGLGLLLAFAYFKTGRLIVPITLHTLFNLYGSGVALIFSESERVMQLYGVFTLACTAAGVALLVRYAAKNRFALSDGPLSAAPHRVIWVNVGMVLALAACVAQFMLLFLVQ